MALMATGIAPPAQRHHRRNVTTGATQLNALRYQTERGEAVARRYSQFPLHYSILGMRTHCLIHYHTRLPMPGAGPQ